MVEVQCDPEIFGLLFSLLLDRNFGHFIRHLIKECHMRRLPFVIVEHLLMILVLCGLGSRHPQWDENPL
jgi:hypothetical protein